MIKKEEEGDEEVGMGWYKMERYGGGKDLS